jgi:hypothetical protein
LQEARLGVRLSKERGLFQTLSVGQPAPIIRWDIQPDSVWVSGPNVAPEYVGDTGQNLSTKKRDADGRLWHCMGDRIQEDDAGWWYSGRSSQSLADFAMEQRIYSFLNHSGAFLFRTPDKSIASLRRDGPMRGQRNCARHFRTRGSPLRKNCA